MIDKLTLEVPVCLSHVTGVYYPMCRIHSAADISTMWPAGAALTHDQRDGVESVDVYSVRPPEDQNDETHLRLSDGRLVTPLTPLTQMSYRYSPVLTCSYMYTSVVTWLNYIHLKSLDSRVLTCTYMRSHYSPEITSTHLYSQRFLPVHTSTHHTS